MIEKLEEILIKNKLKYENDNDILSLEYPFYLGSSDKKIKLFVFEDKEKLYISDKGLFNSVFANCLNKNNELKAFFEANKILVKGDELYKETRVSSCYFDLSDFVMCIAHAEFEVNGDYDED